jgi:hypothetical protein
MLPYRAKIVCFVGQPLHATIACFRGQIVFTHTKTQTLWLCAIILICLVWKEGEANPSEKNTLYVFFRESASGGTASAQYYQFGACEVA